MRDGRMSHQRDPQHPAIRNTPVEGTAPENYGDPTRPSDPRSPDTRPAAFAPWTQHRVYERTDAAFTTTRPSPASLGENLVYTLVFWGVAEHLPRSCTIRLSYNA